MLSRDESIQALYELLGSLQGTQFPPDLDQRPGQKKRYVDAVDFAIRKLSMEEFTNA